jgi:cation diffusion facilitator family transporter
VNENSLTDGSTRVVIAALIGNALVALTKFTAAALSGSSAMFTEAIHSSADTTNQLLLLLGNKRSRASADSSHAFGYGMEIYFWTFIVAVLVLLAGGGVSLWRGVMELRHPQPIESIAVSLGVLALSALFEGYSFLIGYREYRRIITVHTLPNLEPSLWRFIEWSKDPNLYESLLEDLAALVGLAIAAVGVGASGFFGLLWADGVASCLIGLLLIADAIVILMATRSLIAGEAASLPLQKDIRLALQKAPPALAVLDDATLHLGPRTILVFLTVTSAADTPSAALKHALSELTGLVKAVDRRIREVFFRFQ